MVDRDDADERLALLQTLEYQRVSVRSIVEGLDERGWHTAPAVRMDASGHGRALGQRRATLVPRGGRGLTPSVLWDEGRPAYDLHAAFVCGQPSSEILSFYRLQCDRSDEILAVTSLSATPRGSHNDPDSDVQIPSVRWVVLHMIEETAARIRAISR